MRQSTSPMASARNHVGKHVQAGRHRRRHRPGWPPVSRRRQFRAAPARRPRPVRGRCAPTDRLGACWCAAQSSTRSSRSASAARCSPVSDSRSSLRLASLPRGHGFSKAFGGARGRGSRVIQFMSQSRRDFTERRQFFALLLVAREAADAVSQQRQPGAGPVQECAAASPGTDSFLTWPRGFAEWHCAVNGKTVSRE